MEAKSGQKQPNSTELPLQGCQKAEGIGEEEGSESTVDSTAQLRVVAQGLARVWRERQEGPEKRGEPRPHQGARHRQPLARVPLEVESGGCHQAKKQLPGLFLKTWADTVPKMRHSQSNTIPREG